MKIRNVISATLLIAGTTIGAGMLAIPLVTASAGFVPASIITLFVWIFMFLTGLLFLEVTLWMHKDANILSMSKRFLRKKGQIIAGLTFVFLYYCLMVAYFAAGTPLFMSFIDAIFQVKITGWISFGIFGLLFGTIVGVGIKFVDRVNYILMVSLILSYAALVSVGSKAIEVERLVFQNWKNMFLAAPILFSAFGFHNVIPSLTFHFKQNAKLMRYSIFFGSFIPFIIYIIWQWLIIGVVPIELVQTAFDKGQPVTETLQAITGIGWVRSMGRLFALFAIITSMLGVSFSVVDFLGDGLKLKRKGFDRFLLCLLTFVPPFILTSLDPSIFVLAIGIAGGFGEALLNGLFPVLLVWVGRYKTNLKSGYRLFGGKITLSILFLIGLIVIGLETVYLLKKYF